MFFRVKIGLCVYCLAIFLKIDLLLLPCSVLWIFGRNVLSFLFGSLWGVGRICGITLITCLSAMDFFNIDIVLYFKLIMMNLANVLINAIYEAMIQHQTADQLHISNFKWAVLNAHRVYLFLVHDRQSNILLIDLMFLLFFYQGSFLRVSSR